MVATFIIVPVFGEVCKQIHHPVADVSILVVEILSWNQSCLIDDRLVDIREAKYIGESGRVGHTYNIGQSKTCV